MRTLVLTLSLMTLALPHQAMAFKCWINKSGIQECGDTVPPEYAQQQIRTVNERGITTGTTERARTKEELAEERRTREEEQRLMELEKARNEQQAAYDRVLIMTFTSEREIIASRDRKLTALQGTIEITGVTITTLKAKLSSKQRRAANMERSGRKLPDELLAEMANLNRQIAEKKAYIVTRRREQKELRAKYDIDLKRYREITADR